MVETLILQFLKEYFLRRLYSSFQEQEANCRKYSCYKDIMAFYHEFMERYRFYKNAYSHFDFKDSQHTKRTSTDLQTTFLHWRSTLVVPSKICADK